MNNKENLDFLDLLTIISFIVSVQSYEIAIENLKENQEQTENIRKILIELNEHLKQQDNILNSLKGGEKD